MPELALAVVLIAGIVIARRSITRAFEYTLDTPALAVRKEVVSAQLDVRVAALRGKNDVLGRSEGTLLDRDGGAGLSGTGVEDVVEQVRRIDVETAAELVRIEEQGARDLPRRERLRRVAFAVDVALAVIGTGLVIGSALQGIAMAA